MSKKLPQVMSTKEFNSLSRSEKRVLVAKDALEWLKAGYINVKPGFYVDYRFDEYNENSNNSNVVKMPACDLPVTSQAVKTKLKQAECGVCAKGGLFYAAVMRKNQMTFKSFDNMSSNSDRITKYMRGIFTRQKFGAMEIAFEGNNPGDDCVPNELYENALVLHDYFGDRYVVGFANKRFIAICMNVIHNGDFVPPKDREEMESFDVKVLRPYLNRHPKLKVIFNS